MNKQGEIDMCPYAKQNDKRQMIHCMKTAGICTRMRMKDGFWTIKESCEAEKPKKKPKKEVIPEGGEADAGLS